MPVITSVEIRRFSAKHCTGFPRQQAGHVTSDAPELDIEAVEAGLAAHPERTHARGGSVKGI